jgi:TetR/AcrR family transcriptional regulator, transcriptional repressor of bet genes
MPKIVDADQRRLELAEAAARVIARSGVDNASMREIAAEAGWTTGTLVHYFANKHELLDFTLRASIERRSAQRSTRTDLPPADALRSTLRSALPTNDDTRVHWIVTLALAGAAASDPALAATQRDAYRDFRSYVIELLATMDDVGDDEVVVEAERLIALVDGIALQALFDPASWPAERQLRALDAGLRTGSLTS